MTDLDMLATVTPKSDQINYDDLIGGARTIKITKVTGGNDAQQPVNFHFEGDNGKPYRPCKSMRRVVIHVWGAKASDYVGRLMTIYGDPTVKFGGMEVGGIRISHMSHMKAEMKMALTATKGSKKLYTVKPLEIKEAALETPQTQNQGQKQDEKPENLELKKKASLVLNAIKAEQTLEGLEAIFDTDFKPEIDFIKKENAVTFQYLVDELEKKREQIRNNPNSSLMGG